MSNVENEYRYGPNGDWEPWYKNKDCHNCKYYDGPASDGFIFCSLKDERSELPEYIRRTTLPFVQFHPTDCDKFIPRSSKPKANENE